jgi:hypothetical protein
VAGVVLEGSVGEQGHGVLGVVLGCQGDVGGVTVRGEFQAGETAAEEVARLVMAAVPDGLGRRGLGGADAVLGQGGYDRPCS